jgi:hypothetical protein
LKVYGSKVSRTLALIGTPEAIGVKAGRDSQVLILHIVQTSISLSMIDHFLESGQYENANKLLDYAQEELFPELKLQQALYSPCHSDDDNDDADDDEFCYRSGVDKMLVESFKLTAENIGYATLIPYVDGIFTSGSFALDGTILNAQYGCKFCCNHRKLFVYSRINQGLWTKMSCH